MIRVIVFLADRLRVNGIVGAKLNLAQHRHEAVSQAKRCDKTAERRFVRDVEIKLLPVSTITLRTPETEILQSNVSFSRISVVI